MATARINFTKATLAALPPAPAGKQATYHDSRIAGLTLLVTPAGAKTFYVYRRIQGRPERVKLGRFPDLTVEQARNMAEDTNGVIARGGDPAANKREASAAQTFGELFEWYMEHHSKPRKRTWREDLDHHRLHLTHLDRLKLDKVTRTHVRAVHTATAERSGICQANRTLALVKVVFNKAIAAEIFKGPNPAQGIELYREMSRDRRLAAGELPAFLAALETETNDTLRDLVWLLLLTGARRGNMLAMRWDQVDWAAQTWRIPETKNGTSHTAPLGEEAMAILRRRRATEGPWVFPGSGVTGHIVEPKKGWAALLTRAGIENFRLHDLRRTLGSWMVDTGASIAVIGKTLGHKHQATTAIYARLALDPVREAQGRAVAAMLGTGDRTATDAIQTVDTGNIVPLAPGTTRRASARR
jgi:integrase